MNDKNLGETEQQILDEKLKSFTESMEASFKEEYADLTMPQGVAKKKQLNLGKKAEKQMLAKKLKSFTDSMEVSLGQVWEDLAR